jgi:hypothetical protein
MIIRRLAIICFFAAIFFIPATAYTACTVNQYGILYIDSDCDGVIDNTDMKDANLDGIPDGDPVDNCPLARNGDCDKDQYNCDVNGDYIITDLELRAGFQLDWNKNGIGDACEDSDNDGTLDYLDTCRSVFNPTQDPKFCTDTDGDRFEDTIDNCVNIYNTDQLDSDGDGIGDWCDNCRNIFNPAQGENDCPNGDSGDGGGSSVQYQYNTQVPEPTGGLNAEFGRGRMKGNGTSDGCQLSIVTNPFHFTSVAVLAIITAMALIRRRI